MTTLTGAASRENSRPYWQSEPCPSWCNAEHSDRDFAEDRMHFRPAGEVVLTLHGPIRVPDTAEVYPDRIAFYLEQSVTAADPSIVLVTGDPERRVQLTPLEAEKAALVLGYLVARARPDRMDCTA